MPTYMKGFFSPLQDLENSISDSEQHQFAGSLIKKGEKRCGGCAKTICRTTKDFSLPVL